MLSSYPCTQSVYQVWGNSSCLIRKAVLVLPIQQCQVCVWLGMELER